MENIDNMGDMQAANEDKRELPIRKPSLALISIAFSLSLFLFVFVGSNFQNYEFVSGTLINEFILIALPAVLLLFIFKYDIKKVLRLNKISFLNLFIVFSMMTFALPLVGILNGLNLFLIKHLFGKVIVVQPPMLPGTTGLLISIFVIGISPGICEELLFRGVIQRGFERFGAVKAILITAFLFGLMHMDFQRLFGTALLGGLIGFIVYRTNSLYAGMLAHFTNNSLAVGLSYLSVKLSEILKSSGAEGLEAQKQADQFLASFSNMTKVQLIATIIILVILFLFFLGCFIGVIFAFIKNTRVRYEESIEDSEVIKRRNLLWLMPGVALVGFVYFVEGLKLKGISIEALDNFLKLIGLK